MKLCIISKNIRKSAFKPIYWLTVKEFKSIPGVIGLLLYPKCILIYLVASKIDLILIPYINIIFILSNHISYTGLTYYNISISL